MIFRDVDQSAPDIQDQMEQYINDLVDMDTVSYQPSLFWLRDFKDYIISNNDTSLYNASFTDQLDSFLAVPSFSKLYNDDIARDDNGNIILSRTRFSMDNFDINNVTSQINALDSVLDVSASQPINEDRKDWVCAIFVNQAVFQTAMFFKYSFLFCANGASELKLPLCTGFLHI